MKNNFIHQIFIEPLTIPFWAVSEGRKLPPGMKGPCLSPFKRRDHRKTVKWEVDQKKKRGESGLKKFHWNKDDQLKHIVLGIPVTFITRFPQKFVWSMVSITQWVVADTSCDYYCCYYFYCFAIINKASTGLRHGIRHLWGLSTRKHLGRSLS